MRLIFLLLVLEIGVVLSQRREGRRKKDVPQQNCKDRPAKIRGETCSAGGGNLKGSVGHSDAVIGILKAKSQFRNVQMTSSTPSVFMACGVMGGICIPTSNGFTYSRVPHNSQVKLVGQTASADALATELKRYPIDDLNNFTLGCMESTDELACFAYWLPKEKESRDRPRGREPKDRTTSSMKGRPDRGRPDRGRPDRERPLQGSSKSMSPAQEKSGPHEAPKTKDKKGVSQPKNEGPDQRMSQEPGEPMSSPPEGEHSHAPPTEMETKDVGSAPHGGLTENAQLDGHRGFRETEEEEEE